MIHPEHGTYGTENNRKRIRKDKKERHLEPVQFERKYKTPSPARMLSLDDVGIKKVADDEIAVQITDSTDYYISNYSRCIHKLKNGKYIVLRGSKPRTDEWTYSVVVNRWWGGRFKDVRTQIKAYAATIQTFIMNYDMKNNRKIWHTGGKVEDGYYKHLYPVTEEEYACLEQFIRSGGIDSDEAIIRIVNEHHFDNPKIRPSFFAPSASDHGYLGCSKADIKKNGANMKWNQALVRCYNENFQEKHPNYQGSICGDEFLNFSNFQIWFSKYEKMIGDK